MAGKSAALLYFILFLSSGLTAQSYTKDQFSKRVDETASAIKKAEKTYKSIEKEVKRHFPEGKRKSPLYLVIRDDFMEYRGIMKRLNEYNISIDRNSDKFSKLFGGVFKGKDVISTEDEEFSQVLKLAKELEEALSESLNDLARAAPLGNVHRPILDKIVDIERFRDDLNGQINAVSRDIERSSRENGRMLRLFKKSGEGVTDFGIFRNADSVRTKLLDEQSHLESLADSLKHQLNQTQHLLSGTAKRGEEMRVWETFSDISDNRNRLTQKIEKSIFRIEDVREELENLLKLMSEFGDILSEMDKDIALLQKNYQTAMKSLKQDSLRYSSLVKKMARGYTQEKTPYRELRTTFSEAESQAESAEETLMSMAKLRIDLIDHVSGMEGLKTDPGKYDRFKTIDRNFKDANKTGKKIIEKFDDAIEIFRGTIIEHFINTPEYWQLVYKVEFDKSLGGKETIEENFGYLFDPNELPAEDYHGRLISKYQLRLVKQKNRRQQKWNHHLLFSGEHDFPLEGFLLLSSDGTILVKADRDSITVEEETSKDGVVQFEWEVPVSQMERGQLLKEKDLTFRIHLLTATHRVNLTMYKKKIFRDYLIPDKRKQMWERIFQDKIEGG